MPYKIVKQRGKNLYYVMNNKTKKKYSKEGIPLDHAQAQLKAIYANENGYKLSPARRKYYSSTRSKRLSPYKSSGRSAKRS